MGERVRLCASAEVPAGTARRFDIGEHRIALIRVGDSFYALGDRCSHADYSLSEGEVDPDKLKSQLLFEVANDANKVEIRHAVQKLWNVDVVAVRTAIVRGKEKRMGRFVGKRSNWKKAIVTIAAGQTVEFFEGV